jgi:hypothetical protein
MGIYANDLGPQHIFSLPTGILNPHGENTLAIAVLGEDGASAGLGQIVLIAYGRYQGGVPVGLVDSSPYCSEPAGAGGIDSGKGPKRRISADCSGAGCLDRLERPSPDITQTQEISTGRHRRLSPGQRAGTNHRGYGGAGSADSVLSRPLSTSAMMENSGQVVSSDDGDRAMMTPVIRTKAPFSRRFRKASEYSGNFGCYVPLSISWNTLRGAARLGIRIVVYHRPSFGPCSLHCFSSEPCFRARILRTANGHQRTRIRNQIFAS